MTVRELREQISQFSDDTIVTVWADHGQASMVVTDISDVFVHKDEIDKHTMEETHPDDIENIQDYIKVCEIGGF